MLQLCTPRRWQLLLFVAPQANTLLPSHPDHEVDTLSLLRPPPPSWCGISGQWTVLPDASPGESSVGKTLDIPLFQQNTYGGFMSHYDKHSK